MKIAAGMEEQWAQRVSINSDPYGAAVMRYAERWADLMEQRMTPGVSVADVAEQASHDADTEGITGFMYGAAVSELGASWEHGDELRRWHNAQYGVDEEKAQGGTVNPAIISIGGN